MKKLALIVALCLLLTGCMSWMDGAAYSVEPHQEGPKKPEQSFPAVSTYAELLRVMETLVEQGAQTGLLSVERYSGNLLESGLKRAISYIMRSHPIGAYAVTDITYEVGSVGGRKALALTLSYSRSPEEIQAVRPAANMNEAAKLLYEALEDCETSLVLRIEQFRDVDFTQLIEDYAMESPATVMEIPTLTVTCFPETGVRRVVDLRLNYQTNRENLRNMQRYVQPIFTSASLYVSSEEEAAELRYERLYSFLLERNEYKLETSLTPTYSLLRHGVGDSKAFAVVYSAMCRRSGLDCMVVSGTRQGESRFWNIVNIDDVWYHVDLLAPGTFRCFSDEEMVGYVWDYSAYPECGAEEALQETTGT